MRTFIYINVDRELKERERDDDATKKRKRGGRDAT